MRSKNSPSIARHGAACTAIARFTGAIADVASDNDDALHVKLASYANRTTTEWPHVAVILPSMLKSALAGVSKAGEP